MTDCDSRSRELTLVQKNSLLIWTILSVAVLSTASAILILFLRSELSGATSRPLFAARNENVASGSTGSGTKGNVSTFDLRFGDCFKQIIIDSVVIINEVERVSCEEEWQFRITRQMLTTLPGSATYPGGEYFDELRPTECPDVSTYLLWPSRDSWDLGDRVWLCLEPAATGGN